MTISFYIFVGSLFSLSGSSSTDIDSDCCSSYDFCSLSEFYPSKIENVVFSAPEFFFCISLRYIHKCIVRIWKEKKKQDDVSIEKDYVTVRLALVYSFLPKITRTMNPAFLVIRFITDRMIMAD